MKAKQRCAYCQGTTQKLSGRRYGDGVLCERCEGYFEACDAENRWSWVAFEWLYGVPELKAKAREHYVATAAKRGRKPYVCEVFEDVTEAVSYLSDLIELDNGQRHQLEDDGFLALNVRRAGETTFSRGWWMGSRSEIEGEDWNEYVKIVVCDCDDPGVHEVRKAGGST